MVELFSLEGIQRKAAVFDTAKLEWMNGQYLSARPASELVPEVTRLLGEKSIETAGRDLTTLVNAVKTRSRTLVEIADQVATRLPGAKITRDAKATQLVTKLGPAFGQNLQRVADAISALPVASWSAEPLLAAAKATAESSGTKLGDILQPVRVALTGSTVSEPVNELLDVIGRDESLKRIKQAIQG